MTDETWLETWKLKALATSVSSELQRQFGRNEFYSLPQVHAACDRRNVPDSLRACAVAMFVAPEESGDALRDYGISDPADEMRRMLAQKISASDTSSGATDSSFSFHDLSPSHHGFGDSISGDPGCDGGGGGD
jgi:hypothetical protein